MSAQGCLLQMVLCLCWEVGEENGVPQLLSSWRNPPACSEISINRYPSHCVSFHFYVASSWAVVSLRVETQLLSHPPNSVLSQLLVKLLDASPTGIQTQIIQTLWFLRSNVMGICFPPCVSSLVLSPLFGHSSVPPVDSFRPRFLSSLDSLMRLLLYI